jgi:hypothetical protein
LVFRVMRLTVAGIQSKMMAGPPTNEFQWSCWEKIHSAHKLRASTNQVRSSRCDLETKKKYATIPITLSSLVTPQISTTRHEIVDLETPIPNEKEIRANKYKSSVPVAAAIREEIKELMSGIKLRRDVLQCPMRQYISSKSKTSHLHYVHKSI